MKQRERERVEKYKETQVNRDRSKIERKIERAITF